MTEVETALERDLSGRIMRGGEKPRMLSLGGGQTLVDQGTPREEIFLLLDGVLSVEVDGIPVAQVGPGAVLGERALLESGKRTATLRALTTCRVAAIRGAQIAPAALADLAAGHHREEG